MGHDEPCSIFRVQFNDYEMVQDPDTLKLSHPDAARFHMKIPRDGSPFEFAALFVGIGDARHLYCSIADIGVDLRELKKEKEKETAKADIGNEQTKGRGKDEMQTISVHFCVVCL